MQRPTEISIKAQDVKGKKLDLVLKDWQARVFQHEYDHLEVAFPYLISSPLILYMPDSSLRSMSARKSVDLLHWQ